MDTITVYCPKCRQWDSALVKPGSKSQASSERQLSLLDVAVPGAPKVRADLRCRECGGEVFSSQTKLAKIAAFSPVMELAVNAVVLAARGDVSVETAVEHAKYVAHLAFQQRLVPYGPESSK